MSRLDLDWQFRQGRDTDGDLFSSWVLVHSSGRILGKVGCPLNAFEYQYFAYLYVKDAKTESDEDLRFIDADSAKRYIEDALAQSLNKIPGKDSAGAVERKPVHK
jgi:hypothetical protein